jgi:hypothetical protein
MMRDMTFGTSQNKDGERHKTPTITNLKRHNMLIMLALTNFLRKPKVITLISDRIANI